MPVLKAEVGLYPDHLFAADSAPSADGSAWWVLHTKPRQEKSLARQLVERRVAFYLPLIRRRALVRGRPVTSYLPLFTSYLFLRADDDEERIGALSTGRVVQSLKVPEQDKLWQDLRQIHRLIESGAPVTPEDRLAPGMMVEIRSGPLAGMRGKIIRAASGRRFVVQVDFIQRGASVELDHFTLVSAP